MELERRRILEEEPNNLKRALELAAYFTHWRLLPIRQKIDLSSAIGAFAKVNGRAASARIAWRLLELNPDPKV